MPKANCLPVKAASEIALKSAFVRRFFTKKPVGRIRFALKRNGIACNGIIRGRRQALPVLRELQELF